MKGRSSSVWHDLSTHKFCRCVEATKMHYISQRTCRKVSHKIFHKILFGDPAHPEDFDSFRFQTEFLFHYRMDRPSFWRLHQLVKDHPIFMSPQHSRRVQAPSEFQLLVLLKYLGLQGIAASNTSLTSHFQISIGTAEKYRKRAARAVLSLEADSYHWPDDSEWTVHHSGDYINW